jgi:hypothetical protein
VLAIPKPEIRIFGDCVGFDIFGIFRLFFLM